MRKIILISFVMIILAAAGAASFVWFNRAAELKKDVAERITSLNTPNGTVSYEAITISGFPMSMNVSIVKPHFTGRIDKMLEDLSTTKSLGIEVPSEWSEDYTLDGSIDLSVNALSDKFTMSVRGAISGKGIINGKNIAINGQSNGDASCVLTIERSGEIFTNLWDFYSLKNDDLSLIKRFRSLNCEGLGGKIVNGDTQELLSNSDGISLHISNIPQKDRFDATFRLSVKDIEVTKAYDGIYAIYTKALTPKQRTSTPSAYGKQNFELDLSYNGTENWTNPEAMDMPIEIKINKFSISNAAYQANTNLNLTSELKGDVRNANLVYRTELTGTELFRTLFKEQLNSLADTFRTEEDPNIKIIKDKLDAITPESLDMLISSVIPDFATLGKMVAAIDANYSGSKDFSNFQAKLGGLEFSATPYGITATGSAKRDKTRPIPSGNLAISCNNCLKMMDDMLGYFNSVKATVAVFSPVTVNAIPPEIIQATKDFLLAIQSETSTDKNNLKFDIISDGAAGLTVNGRNANEVSSLFSKIIMPILQKN